ncbi:hypothetical protein EAF04_006013 [Stromatinia cepivora]|nr:hypothetical protein EAF04_006013 [Stromatinia cepivora]
MKIRLPNGLFLASIVALKVTGSPLNGVTEDDFKSDKVFPSPLVIPASQYFDGDDGEWSSLALRVGTPAQDVRVLVSTNSPQTLVVLPLGCTSANLPGLFGINEYGVGFQADLGYSQSADSGSDSIGLGYVLETNNPTLYNQIIGSITTPSPFYTGIFGLGTQPVNFTTIGNSSATSYFSSLWSQKLIPSLTWSYTAVAKYRLEFPLHPICKLLINRISGLKAGQYAQLILGGYDTSRFTPNSVTFTLASDVDRDIVVTIQAITYSGNTQASLLKSPTYAFIESTDPNFWLSEPACQEFGKVFGLSLDDNTGLYLMNSTQYSLLTAINPQVTFTLANALTGGDTASIVSPFNTFTLSASYPFVPNDTYYFPLRRSANDSQNTLGRAFLHEAYLTVDYKRGNFTELLGGFYLYRRRKRPTSIAEIALRRMVGDFSNDGSRMTPPPNPSTIPPNNYSTNTSSSYDSLRDVKVPMVEAPGHESREPVELQSHDLNKQSDFIQFTNKPAEIYTTTSGDSYEDYATAARRMDTQRKFAMAYEIDASHTIFELPADHTLVEIDDERSRHTLSPQLSRSLVSRHFSFQDDSLLLQHSSYQNISPAVSPAVSPAISARSPSPRVSSEQGRISPLDFLTRQSSTLSSSNPTDRKQFPSPNLEPPIERYNSLRSVTGNSNKSGISEESAGTPLSMKSPTLARPSSMFMRTFSKSGKLVWNGEVVPDILSRNSSDATTSDGRKSQNPNNSWFF